MIEKSEWQWRKNMQSTFQTLFRILGSLTLLIVSVFLHPSVQLPYFMQEEGFKTTVHNDSQFTTMSRFLHLGRQFICLNPADKHDDIMVFVVTNMWLWILMICMYCRYLSEMCMQINATCCFTLESKRAQAPVCVGLRESKQIQFCCVLRLLLCDRLPKGHYQLSQPQAEFCHSNWISI